MVAKLAAEKKSADLPLIRLRVFTRCVLVCPRLEAWSHSVLCVRCRAQVDYTGFPKINVQRFGRDFLGKIANCGSSVLFLASFLLDWSLTRTRAEDILSFHRQRKVASKGASATLCAPLCDVADCRAEQRARAVPQARASVRALAARLGTQRLLTCSRQARPVSHACSAQPLRLVLTASGCFLQTRLRRFTSW
jgi:hypothetical protein